MKNLEKWQFISFVSRGVAMGLGIIQGIAVVRILSVSQYGMVGIVASIGSIFGVSQNLGLASGSTREISGAKDKEEISKIFFTSAVIKYVISIPMALILFGAARYFAVDQYSNPELIVPLKIYAFVLLIQGVQSLFNSLISGTQRFKTLFVYQGAIAFVSVFLYIPLVYFFNLNGYFYAMLAFNIIASITLGYFALRPLKGHFSMPDKQDFKTLLKAILSISLAIYAVKIIYTFWQRSGPLLLGLSVSAEAVGFFSFALFYATKLMAISDAVTDVNLPVFSKEFKENLENFKSAFSFNFNKIYVFIVFAAFSAVYWLQEIVFAAVGSDKYVSSFPLVLPLVYAFIFYSLVNIVKSSIMVPAKLVTQLIAGYLALMLLTVGAYYAFALYFDPLLSMAYAMLSGSIAGFFALLVFSYFRLGLIFFKFTHAVVVGFSLLAAYFGSQFVFEFSWASFITLEFLYKMLIYVLFAVTYLMIVISIGFVTRSDFVKVARKLKLLK